MSRHTSTALCLICAIFMVFNLLASVLVYAENDDTVGITSDSVSEGEGSADSEQTTADPEQTTADPEQTTADPEQTTDPDQTPSDTDQSPSDSDETTGDPENPPAPLIPVAFEIDIPADFPTAYREGDIFSTEGLSGTITYDNGMTAPTTNIECDAPSPLTPSVTSISFTCKEAPEIESATTLTITVAAILAIDVTGDALNAVYYEGDTFGDEQIASLTINVIYEDGTKKAVPYSDCKIFGHNAPLPAGSPNIIVTYRNFSQSIRLNVIELPKITDIEIKPTAAFDRYFTEGDTFDPTGLMIMAKYSGGKNPEVIAMDGNFSAVQFSPALDVALSVLDKVVTVTYSDGTNVFTADIDIVVVPDSISSIRVSKVPNKTHHFEGECFDYTGMELTVVYSNGTAITITENFTVSHTDTPFILKSGTAETVNIEITYLDKTCIHPVNVIPKDVKSLTVLSKPIKLVYNEGESFDPQGLVLILNYVDTNLPATPVPNDYYEIPYSGPLSATDTYVEIKFRGETVKVDITVIPKSTEPGTTAPIDPPVTPDNPGDSDSPIITTDPSNTTPGTPIVTTDPSGSAPESPSNTTEETTVSPSSTTAPGDGEDDGGSTTLIVLWIIILTVIVVALVVLIIYYKRNFT